MNQNKITIKQQIEDYKMGLTIPEIVEFYDDKYITVYQRLKRSGVLNEEENEEYTSNKQDNSKSC